VEAAEGEIVAARARIAASQTGDASSRLEALVERSDESGYLAARRSASRELRAAGRRLRPAPGSDWAGLSTRERDIALMVAEGLGNREIAVELHLSEHTVRAHVSRVLAAFGAASRFVVAARVAELFPDAETASAAALTPRQEAVAQRIARGAGNAEIGGELGLSVKTVEKHVGEIFRRWEVASRVGIARRYRSLRQAPS
jgi:DNA-binding NarL/FixJ family response regulator